MADSARTEALARFRADERALFGLIGFVGQLIARADDVSVVAAKALLDTARHEHEKAQIPELQETIARGGSGVREAMQANFAQLFTQVVFQRAVDNFLVYLSELLRLVFVERPEALRSSETVKVEDVLRYSSMDELVQALVERRVERLTYLSLADLQDDLQRSLGLELFDDPDDLARAVRLVAVRNLLAHNRAIVNERYLRQAPDSRFTLGEAIFLNADETMDDFKFLEDAARRIDATAIAHFQLKTVGAG